MPIIQSLVNYFCAQQSAKKVALFRILFGIFLLFTELSLAGHLKEWYSDQGFYTGEYIKSLGEPLHFSILYYVHSLIGTYILYFALIISTVLYILGLWSKPANAVMYILFLSFQLRNLEVQNGGFEVLRVMLFFSLFLDTDRAYTFKWYSEKYSTAETWVGGWPVRLLQFQIVIIYLFTVILKLQTPEWYNGSFVYNVVSNANFFQCDGTWLIRYPIIINILTYFSVVTELFFPILVWFKSTRLYVLAAVLVLHIGLIITMNTLWFNHIMIACLVLFLSTDEVERIEKYIVRFFQRMRGVQVPVRNVARF